MGVRNVAAAVVTVVVVAAANLIPHHVSASKDAVAGVAASSRGDGSIAHDGRPRGSSGWYPRRMDGEDLPSAWSHLLTAAAKKTTAGASLQELNTSLTASTTTDRAEEANGSWFQSSGGANVGLPAHRWAVGIGVGWCSGGVNVTPGYRDTAAACFDSCLAMIGSGPEGSQMTRLEAVDFWFHHNTSRSNCFCQDKCR